MSNTNNALALAFGVVMVMLIIASSLWLVTHSNYNSGECINDGVVRLERINR